MQTIATQLQTTRQMLAPVAGDAAALEARVLAAHAWGMTAESLVRDAQLPCDAAPFTALIERRRAGEPVAQIIGYKEFWRDRFFVTRDVLTPRPESELMLDALLQQFPDKNAALRILDLGTGSGCLLLSALREYPNASGVGVDASAAALNVAQKNAAALGLAARSNFILGNWCEGLQGPFDVVLANPPYIPTATIATLTPDVQHFEPHMALDGGADGLDDYRKILATLLPLLAPDALVVLEVGIHQAETVAAIGTTHGFSTHAILPDLAGIARTVLLQPNTNL